MVWHNLLFAYVGPDTVLPLASVVAGAFGVLLVFWNLIWGWTKRGVRRLLGRHDVPTLPADLAVEPAPELPAAPAAEPVATP
jgi:hypothetical protein